MRAIRKVRITPIQAPRPIISLVLVQRKSLKMSPHRRKIVRRRNEPILITSILWFISPACWSLKETIITSFDEKEWKRNRQKIFYAFIFQYALVVVGVWSSDYLKSYSLPTRLFTDSSAFSGFPFFFYHLVKFYTFFSLNIFSRFNSECRLLPSSRKIIFSTCRCLFIVEKSIGFYIFRIWKISVLWALQGFPYSGHADSPWY